MQKNSGRNKGEFIAGILLLLLSVFLDVGVWTFFSPCAAKEDGGFMMCHWAGVATGATALLLTVHIILLILARNRKVKRGILLTMAPTVILMLLFPDFLIPLCMMPDMRCRMITRPAVLAVGILMIGLIIINIGLNKRGEKRDGNPE